MGHTLCFPLNSPELYPKQIAISQDYKWTQSLRVPLACQGHMEPGSSDIHNATQFPQLSLLFSTSNPYSRWAWGTPNSNTHSTSCWLPFTTQVSAQCYALKEAFPGDKRKWRLLCPQPCRCYSTRAGSVSS